MATQYLLKYEDIFNLSKTINDNKDNWEEKIDKLQTEINSLCNSSNMNGAYYEGIKEYFCTVHEKLISDIKTVIEIHAGNYKLFYTDLHNIDSYDFARIEKIELDNIKQKIERNNNCLKENDKHINRELNNISDLLYINRSNVKENAYDKHLEINKMIEKLDNKIVGTDGNHMSHDFSETVPLIEVVTNLIKECIEHDRSFISNFSNQSLTELKNWDKLCQEGYSAREYLNANEYKYALAEDTINNIEKQQREKKSEKIKFWVAVGAAVVSAVIIVAFPGLGVVAAGAITGALTACANKSAEVLTDEYVEKGNLKNLKVGEAALEIGISTATGAVTGAIGGAVGGSVNNIESTAAQYGIKVGEKSAEDVIERASDNIVECVKGNLDFKSVIAKTFDPKEIGKDAISNAVGVGVDKIVGDKVKNVAEKRIEKIIVDSKKVKAIDKGIGKAMSGTVKGIIGRAIDKGVDGYQGKEIIEDAFDGREIVKDALTKCIEGGATEYTDQIRDEKKN